MKKYKFYVICYQCEKRVESDYTVREEWKHICLDCLYDKKEESR